MTSEGTTSRADGGDRPGDRPRVASVRHIVMVLVAFAAGSAYLTRHGLAVANTTIQLELGLSDEQMGWVMGSFAAGYFLFQIPGGWLGNVIGTRAALAVLSTLWSVLTVWTAAASGFVSLWVSRATFGSAQAGLVPLSARIVNDWFPLSQRGVISAVIGASMSVGGVAALGLTGLLLEHFDWRDVFRMYSVVGIVWSIAFFACFRTRPEDHPWIGNDELKHILEARPAATARNEFGETAESDTPQTAAALDNARQSTQAGPQAFWWSMALSPTIWAINAQAFFRAAAYTFFVTWFPAVLEYRYDSSPELAGQLSTIPLTAVIVGTMLGGVLVDFVLRKTGSSLASRSGVAFFALALAGVFVLSCRLAPPRDTFVILMSLAAFCSGIGNPCGWAATMDVAATSTSLVMAVMNMAGTLGGFAMPVVLGYVIGEIQRTGGDWDRVILIVGGVYAAGAVCWIAVDPRQPVAEGRSTSRR